MKLKSYLLIIIMLFTPIAYSELINPFEPSDWLYYHGTHETVDYGQIGTEWMMTAIRLTPTELSGYDGYQLTTVKFMHRDDVVAYHNGDVRIYANGTVSSPGALITNESFNVTGDGWRNITLSSPVIIDETEEYWVAVNITLTHPPTYDWYSDIDEGPAVDGKGDWYLYSGAGSWAEFQDLGIEYDINWMIEAGLEEPEIVYPQTLILRPNANGYNNRMEPVNGTPNWVCVDDIVADDNYTYVINPEWGDAYINWDEELYNLENSFIFYGEINHVTVYCKAYYDSSVASDLETFGFTIMDSNPSNSSTYTNLASDLGHNQWVLLNHTWANNPWAASNWVWSAIDDLQIGAYFSQIIPPPQDYTKWTQMYLEVNYTLNFPRWDLNQDGAINYLDGSILVSHYGEEWSAGWILSDINSDGFVDYLDVSTLLEHYGESYI